MRSLQLTNWIEQRRLQLSFQCRPQYTVHVLENDLFQSECCAVRLRALSEPIRLRIIAVLRHGHLTVGEIAGSLASTVTTISHHLRILKLADLVEVERQGRFMKYRLRKGLLQQAVNSPRQYLDLGCCRLEIPEGDSGAA